MEQSARGPGGTGDLRGAGTFLPTELGNWPVADAPLALVVVKLAADGSVVTEYPGEVVPYAAPPPWIAVRAVWRNRLVRLDGLEFHPGDTLLEYFSPVEWFNVFEVQAPGGSLRGWYANVTYPTRFDASPIPPRLTWHDLFVDVVLLPGGHPAIRDEDELAASAISVGSELHARIVAGRDGILERIRRRTFPFDRDENGPWPPP